MDMSSPHPLSTPLGGRGGPRGGQLKIQVIARSEPVF